MTELIAKRRRQAPAAPVADTLDPLLRRWLGPGSLVALRAWDGSRSGPIDAPVTVVVHSPNALRRMLYAPGELGLARAHVAGELDVEGDLAVLMNLGDRPAGDGQDGYSPTVDARAVAEVWRAGRRLGVIGRPLPPPPEEVQLRGRRHSRRRDAEAVSHHYDVGNPFYELLLGPSLTYSCAYFPENETSLEEAQTAKHELVCRKLDLHPGARLLDVGCGWGSMAMHAARHHGASAVGVTVSRQQQRLASERVAAAGLTDRVEIRLQDYREVTDGPFDAISSIGMFEHVGVTRMQEYFSTLHGLLRPRGRLLNHAISRPEPSSRPTVDPNSFMGRYVFPDSALMEVGTVVSAMQAVGLEVRDVQSLREHYARTLQAWVANLEQNWDDAQHLAGPGRARVWRLYLTASIAGFTRHRTSVHQVLGVRPDHAGGSGMAPTRAGVEVRETVVDLVEAPNRTNVTAR